MVLVHVAATDDVFVTLSRLYRKVCGSIQVQDFSYTPVFVLSPYM